MAFFFLHLLDIFYFHYKSVFWQTLLIFSELFIAISLPMELRPGLWGLILEFQKSLSVLGREG